MSSHENVRSTAASGSQVYESKRAVFEYLLFHYGSQSDLSPFAGGPTNALKFPERCAEICSNMFNSKDESLRALDIGCSVGGSTFQLTKRFTDVVGIDFSQHFVDAANVLKRDGSMDYEMLQQGTIFHSRTAVISSDIHRSKAQFLQGDACNLSTSLGQFDVVLASNLLCRLPNPRKFLLDIPQFITSNGYLVLVSPYSWLEEYTPKSEWIGAQQDGQTSHDAFHAFMTEHVSSLKKVKEEEVPFLIREHERKYQYGVSSCTVWQKVV